MNLTLKKQDKGETMVDIVSKCHARQSNNRGEIQGTRGMQKCNDGPHIYKSGHKKVSSHSNSTANIEVLASHNGARI